MDSFMQLLQEHLPRKERKMDYSRWIYSEEFAVWLFGRTELDVRQQAACICTAPHRTVAEKLEGLKSLQAHTGDECLEKKIRSAEAFLHRVSSGAVAGKYLYGAAIYWCGDAEWFQPEVFYRTADEAVQEIVRRIEDAAARTERNRESFYGVVAVFSDTVSWEYRRTENMVIRHDGQILYWMPDFGSHDMWEYIAPEPFNAMRIPYFSGTVIEIAENPFMNSLKGVLVNLEAEPDEDGFADYNAYYQWIIYPEYGRNDLNHGIGVTALRDDYAPFLAGNPDILFPYRQFIRKYEIRKEDEQWLGELGRLIRQDRDCIVEAILGDRYPRKPVDADGQRMEYVRELAALMDGLSVDKGG